MKDMARIGSVPLEVGKSDVILFATIADLVVFFFFFKGPAPPRVLLSSPPRPSPDLVFGSGGGGGGPRRPRRYPPDRAAVPGQRRHLVDRDGQARATLVGRREGACCQRSLTMQ